MPAHWFYRPGDILRTFGPAGIVDMEPAPQRHPSSIMSLHSTSAGGRRGASASAAPDIVGDVILKGRRELWNVPGVHYHHGLPAGENTLNAWCARWLMEYLIEAGDYDAQGWTERYVERMTADPPAHPDTYAESYHRGFFANLAAGKPPLGCGAVTHDTPSMGALVTVAPLALQQLHLHGLAAARRTCRQHVAITHPDEGLLDVVDAYVSLLHAQVRELRGDAWRAALVEAAAAVPGTRLDRLLGSARADNEMIGPHWSLACYIADSWPSVCWLAARHVDDADRALRINTNLGGENAHRGAVLGTLVGPSSQQAPALFEQLHRRDELAALIERFVEAFTTRQGASPETR